MPMPNPRVEATEKDWQTARHIGFTAQQDEKIARALATARAEERERLGREMRRLKRVEAAVRKRPPGHDYCCRVGADKGQCEPGCIRCELDAALQPPEGDDHA